MNDKNKTDSLGLHRDITRRDFINGVLVGSAALALPFSELLAESEYTPEKVPGYYPPGLTGLRNDATIFSAAHGKAWSGISWNNPEVLDEEYDVVVVGAGASGLAAAIRYQQIHGKKSRILILDNHDDFGGHARRNEFEVDGRTYLHPGGSVRLATERINPTTAKFLKNLGIDVEGHREAQAADPRNRAYDLDSAVYFSKKQFGEDKTIVGDILPYNRLDAEGNYELLKHIDDMPLAAVDKESLRAYLSAKKDILSDLNDNDKTQKLKSISYAQFMTDMAGLSVEAGRVLFTYTKPISSYDADDMPAYVGMLYGLPGFNLLGDFGEKQMASHEYHGDPNIYFPDGNGSVSRLFVKKLTPKVSKGKGTIEAVIDQRFDYSKLDDSRSKVKIRLNSTVVSVKNNQSGVDIVYVRGGKPFKVSAKHTVLACYNMMIPYLCPEIPEAQKRALSYNVKIPYLAVNVLLRTGKPVLELGAASFHCPEEFFGEVLACGRDFGAHKQSLNESDPVALYLIDNVLDGTKNQHIKERYRLGRRRMLTMSFEDLEAKIREQLAGMFATTSFDVNTDIIGITVNRWGHGYSYSYNSLFDPKFEKGAAPHQIARAKFGNIAIANSDAGVAAALEVAIEQGIRAADELS